MRLNFKIVLSLVMFFLNFCVYYFKVDAENIEEKIKCTATINDDFSLDSIIIILNKEETLKFNDYSLINFKKYNFTNIYKLSKNTEKLVKQKLNGQENDNNIINADKYRTKLCLQLEKCNPKTDEEILAAKTRILNIVNELAERDEFLYVGVNYQYETNNIEINDPKHSSNVEFFNRIKLFEAWEICTGSPNISVGIIDSGINGQHEDLIENIDPVLSKSFSQTLTDPLIDEQNHGTAVASIIGATPNNGIGFSGICWDVNLVSLKVAEEKEYSNRIEYVCSATNVINAIDYATEKNIMILNCSFSLSNEKVMDTVLEQTISEFPGIVICSAGNHDRNLDTTDSPVYPASYNLDNIICVGATNGYDDVHEDSNIGSTTVDLFAPGLIDTAADANGSYRNFGQTSCAAPIVTGLVVLLKAYRPYFSFKEIKNVIMGTVDIMNNYTGKCVSNGRINFYRALQNCDSFHDHSMSGLCVYFNESTHFINCPCGLVGHYPHVVLTSNQHFCILCKHEIENGFIGINFSENSYSNINNYYPMGDYIIILNDEVSQ